MMKRRRRRRRRALITTTFSTRSMFGLLIVLGTQKYSAYKFHCNEYLIKVSLAGLSSSLAISKMVIGKAPFSSLALRSLLFPRKIKTYHTEKHTHLFVPSSVD